MNRIEGFKWSDRDYDWLGGGIYFWEYAPKQALTWAKLRQKQYIRKADKNPEDVRRATEPLAVVACMIRLGYCLDLTEPDNVKYVGEVFDEYKENLELAGEPLPTNERQFRRLDCAVFNYAYASAEKFDPGFKVDTARGVYVPTVKKKRIWAGSWISHDTHIQLCVRNPANILGAWLHQPTVLGVDDVCKALQVDPAVVERTDTQSEEVLSEDVQTGKDRPDGQGRGDDPGAGRDG
ncbi:MAG: hypothetical protein ACRDD1_01340 [Planctomycetia bacterium]